MGKYGNSDRLSFLGLQNHCSHEIKRCLLLGRKAIINLDSILKSRDITLATNIHLVKAMVFVIVMYGWDNWTIKKKRLSAEECIVKAMVFPIVMYGWDNWTIKKKRLSAEELMLSNCGTGEEY